MFSCFENNETVEQKDYNEQHKGMIGLESLAKCDMNGATTAMTTVGNHLFIAQNFTKFYSNVTPFTRLRMPTQNVPCVSNL